MIIKTIEIPQYILEVPLTKGRRAKKNSEGKITNAAWLKKPRMKRINGQDLWVGMDEHLRSKLAKELKKYLYEHIRDMEEIKTFPIGVDMEFHCPIPENHAKLPDIDNMSVWYRKCFHDALAGSVDYILHYVQNVDKEGNIVMKKNYLPNHADYPPKIPDDNILYIQEANSKHVPCATLEDRKLVITIRTV